MLRQKFGSLDPAFGGLVTVGIGDGAVQYVSSSLSRSDATPAAAVLTPQLAWLKAAVNVGKTFSAGDLAKITTSAGWTRFKVAGLAQEQMSGCGPSPSPTAPSAPSSRPT